MIALTMFAVSCDNKPVEPKEYTVTFETGTESIIEAVKVEEGKTVARPEDPENTGMVLVGWYLGESEYDFATPVKSDLTLKAVWGLPLNNTEFMNKFDSTTKTFKLNDNIVVTESLLFQNGDETYTIDLNGKNILLGNNRINLYSDEYKGESFKGSSLKVVGKGKISTDADFVFCISGTGNSEKNSKINLTIDKDVIIEGNNTGNNATVIAIFNEDKKNESYDVVVDIYGTVIGKQPLWISGNIKNEDARAPKINIHENAKIIAPDSSGIYIAGYSRVIIDKNAEITSAGGNAVSIAAGELTVNGAIINGGSTYGTDPSYGGSITSTTSSAIFVKQHVTNLNVKVVINSGSFSAYVPFNQATGYAAEKEKTPEPDKVSILINGGEFTSTSSETSKACIKSDDKTGFISGGIFSVAPATKYIADGYEAKATGTNWTVVKITE